jgi:hypothetical protein
MGSMSGLLDTVSEVDVSAAVTSVGCTWQASPTHSKLAGATRALDLKDPI